MERAKSRTLWGRTRYHFLNLVSYITVAFFVNCHDKPLKALSNGFTKLIPLLNHTDIGLDNDEGVPSDDEEEEEEDDKEAKEEEKEEKKDSPEKAKTAPAPFVFGSTAPKLVGSDDSSKTFGFGTSTGFSFSSVAGTNIFAKKDGGMLIQTIF